MKLICKLGLFFSLCLFSLSCYGKAPNDQKKDSSSAQELVGQFKNNTEYLMAVKTLIRSSQETENRIAYIKDAILPNFKGGKVLDIGVGNGELTHIFCKHFDALDLIDPSIEALDSIKEEEFPTKIIKKSQMSIEDYNFPKNHYDLVVNSHTLYHLPRNKWKAIIEKSHESLKSSGIQLIILNNGLGRGKLTKAFGGKNSIDIEKLIEECIGLKNVSMSVIPLYETFKTSSLEEVLQIASVCLHDNNASTSKKNLKNYLANKFKDGNYYNIDFCQYFIILKKK